MRTPAPPDVPRDRGGMKPSAWTRLGPAGFDHGPKLFALSLVALRLGPGLRLKSCPQVSSSTKVLPLRGEPSRCLRNHDVCGRPAGAPRPQPQSASAHLRERPDLHLRGTVAPDDRANPRGPSPAVRPVVRGDEPQGAGRGPRAPARALERAERSGAGARRGRGRTSASIRPRSARSSPSSPSHTSTPRRSRRRPRRPSG